jgi:hypothetical protein
MIMVLKNNSRHVDDKWKIKLEINEVYPCAKKN